MRRAVVAAVVVAFTALAHAQPKDPAAAQAAFAEGQQRYAAGEYLIAADKFEAAYALDPDPVYLFNSAQAYRFGNACAKAVTTYQKFLDAAPQAPNVAKVRQYMTQSEDCARQQAAAQRPPPPVPDPTVTPRPSPPTHGSHGANNPGRTKRLAGLGLGGVGVVVLGVAGYFSYKSFDYASQREELCNGCMWSGALTQQQNRLNSDGETAETVARINLVVGGVALLGGVGLYLWGRSDAAEHPTVTVIPTGTGAMAVGNFAF